MRNLYVARTRDQAIREAAPYLTTSYQTFSSWGLFQEILGERPDVDYDQAAKRAILGDPDEVAEQVADFMAGSGINYLLIRMQWTGMPTEYVHRCLDLFAGEVVPKVRAALAAPRPSMPVADLGNDMASHEVDHP